MGWLFVPGLAGSSSDYTSSSVPPFPPSATWRGKPTPPRCWRREWQTGGWPRLLSGLTSPPSTAAHGVAEWISSLPASPASPGPAQGQAAAPKTNAGSGLRSCEWFAKWDPSSSSWRTSRLSLFEEGLPPFSGTWPTSGSMRSGRCYQRQPSAHHISGNGCSFSRGLEAAGLWLTPLTSDTNGPRVEDGKRSVGLVSQVSTWAKRWPTPTAADLCGHAQSADSPTPGQTGGTTLPGAARSWDCSRQDQTPTGQGSPSGSGPACPPTERRLNPSFVEWLMGWPPGWACAVIGSAQQVTGWCLSAPPVPLPNCSGERVPMP